MAPGSRSQWQPRSAIYLSWGHPRHIYDELGVRDRAAAVAEGYRRRLLTCHPLTAIARQDRRERQIRRGAVVRLFVHGVTGSQA